MHIQERIISRKIFVISLYEQIVQSLRYTDSFVFMPDHSTEAHSYKFPLFQDQDDAIQHMGYMVEWFFDDQKTGKTIDVSFLKPMIQQRENHIDHIIAIIDKHCTTFSFEKMDPMDKAIFLTGGIEYLVHHTPKEVLLNEMIEIAKRYGDTGSAKLINGIGHKVIEDLSKEENNK